MCSVKPGDPVRGHAADKALALSIYEEGSASADPFSLRRLGDVAAKARPTQLGHRQAIERGD
jgi:hypothetical protein